jgi:hypothetical protein
MEAIREKRDMAAIWAVRLIFASAALAVTARLFYQPALPGSTVRGGSPKR